MDKDIESRVSSIKLFCALFSVLCFLLFFTGCADSHEEPPLQDRVDFLTLQQKDLQPPAGKQQAPSQHRDR